MNVRILFCAMQMQQQLYKILKNLDVAKASGIDQISVRFLKDDAPVMAIHLANIINMSIKLDTFPSKCQVAKIKPLLKKGIKTEAKNYRPISLLPLISTQPVHYVNPA